MPTEPQNWLMNHRTYDGQRFSPLDAHQQGQRQGPQARLCGARSAAAPATNSTKATPLAEDGFLYITDSWGVLYKIDARSGDAGRIVWRMDPKQEQPERNRGAALWGNLVITGAGESAARASSPPTRRPARSSGRPTFPDTPDVTVHRGAARHQGQDHRRRRRAATRACATGSPALDAATGKRAVAANTPFRRPASPAARPGRTRTTPGRPAAARCG